MRSVGGGARDENERRENYFSMGKKKKYIIPVDAGFPIGGRGRNGFHALACVTAAPRPAVRC